MDTRIPSRREPIEHYVHRENAGRRVGVDVRCACGETRAQALIPGSPVRCMQCNRRRQGRRIVDLHHVAGEANDPTTIPVFANDHAADLSERQRDWPRNTLENPHGDPALRGAACVRGVADMAHYLFDKALLWVAELLEAISDFMISKFGPEWFRGTPIERFAPKRKGEQ